MATITTTATPMAPYREACGWEKIRPTRIEPSDTTAPIPISASTPHLTHAVTSSANACIPGGAWGQTAAVTSARTVAAGDATNPRAPPMYRTRAVAACTPAGPAVSAVLTGPPSGEPTASTPPHAGAGARVAHPAPAARPAIGRRRPPA